jgi:hypothetical protein
MLFPAAVCRLDANAGAGLRPACGIVGDIVVDIVGDIVVATLQKR